MSSSSESSRATHMASGHAAGMQSGKEFGEREREIRDAKAREMKAFGASESGVGAETTYRDKSGRKLDMVNQYMRTQAIQEGKKLKIEEAQKEWGKSSVQKEMEIERLQELAEVAAGPFARTADDPKLEKARKEALHEGDPMYEHFMRQRRVEEENSRESYDLEGSRSEAWGGRGSNASKNSSSEGGDAPQRTRKRKKPTYSGPNVTPNRFSVGSNSKPVLPGYRWDGVDRSNKLEKKILLRMNERAELREDGYKWSVSDM